jgi:hypothetical protein
MAKKDKPFPTAICVMSDRAEVCKPKGCPVDVHKCFPNYNIPKEK